MLAAVAEANVSGKELVVLISLMRYQKDAGGEVWRPVSEIAAECGLSESNVRNKLTSLTRKTFRGKDGSPVPVITRVREGHRGRAAVVHPQPTEGMRNRFVAQYQRRCKSECATNQ
jgi:predicted transcriptional regulator